MEPAKIPCVSAQWTHEAAREGRPVSEHPEGMNGGPRGKGPTQASQAFPRSWQSKGSLLQKKSAIHRERVPILQCLQLTATCQRLVRAGLNVPSHKGSMSLDTKGLPRNKEQPLLVYGACEVFHWPS